MARKPVDLKLECCSLLSVGPACLNGSDEPMLVTTVRLNGDAAPFNLAFTEKDAAQLFYAMHRLLCGDVASKLEGALERHPDLHDDMFDIFMHAKTVGHLPPTE